MKATANWIRNLNAERAAKVKPLHLELNSVIRDDSKPAEYRQRRERELRAQIAGINDGYAKRIGEAAMEAAQAPRQRVAAGSPLKADELAEAELIRRQYENRPARQERQQLVTDIAEALDAGDTRGALVKARAAKALNIPLGPLAAQLHRADPVKREAQDELDVLEGLAELALAEPIREQASAGLLGRRESLYLKAFADQRGLRPDVPFPDQVEPGYSGPDVKRDGTPLNPFPEPHDPERDRQRQRSEQLRDRAAAEAYLEQRPVGATAETTTGAAGEGSPPAGSRSELSGSGKRRGR